MIECRLVRKMLTPEYTLGRLYLDDEFFGYTCEDADRDLENGGVKVFGKTAIPRGTYPLVVSFSNRFRKIMPEVLRVPGFAGVRIHGGNTAEDTLGCILLGAQITDHGVRDCAEINKQLIAILVNAAEDREQAVLEIV